MEGYAAPKNLRPIKQEKEMLKQDVALMRESPEALGLSQAEREQMVSEQQSAAAAQRQGAQTDLARTALAGQDFQQGAFAQAQENIAAQAASTGAQAARSATDASMARVTQQEARIRRDLAAAAERNRKQAQFWAQMGINAAGTALGALGGPAGLAAMGVLGTGKVGAAIAAGGTEAQAAQYQQMKADRAAKGGEQ